MDKIIEEVIGKLKSEVEKIANDFCREGASPQSLTKLERSLFERVGEFAREVESAALEAADVENKSIKIDGVAHYFKYKGPQEYQGLFGKMVVRRSVYQANGEKTLCPLELNAGILHHHLTPLAAEFVAYSSSFMVATELVKYCQRWQHLSPSETVIKLVAGEVGEMAETLQELYEAEIHEQESIPEATEVVTISRDGTSVNIRNEGWRQAQAGAIACYGPLVESQDEAQDDRRNRLTTVYLGQMPQGERTPSFDAKFERELAHTIAQAPKGCLIACLADGALSIWKYFKSHPELKNAVHINDFHHAAEHLSEISEALFGKGTPRATRWFEKHRSVLKRKSRGVERVIRSICYYKCRAARRSKEREKVVREGLRYFRRNRSRMQYAKYRAQGLPIGSGVVEAACKTVIGHRLKRSGMRWTSEGGQNILNLRTVVLSNRWDAFWKCHERTLGATRISA